MFKHPKAQQEKQKKFVETLEQYLQQGRQIVYGDESGFAQDMPRLSGYSLLGKRCFGLRNFGEKKRTNVIGALYAGSLLTVFLFNCNIDTEVLKFGSKMYISYCLVLGPSSSIFF